MLHELPLDAILAMQEALIQFTTKKIGDVIESGLCYEIHVAVRKATFDADVTYDAVCVCLDKLRSTDTGKGPFFPYLPDVGFVTQARLDLAQALLKDIHSHLQEMEKQNA